MAQPLAAASTHNRPMLTRYRAALPVPKVHVALPPAGGRKSGARTPDFASEWRRGATLPPSPGNPWRPTHRYDALLGGQNRSDAAG